MLQALFEVRKITYRYQDVIALRGLSLTVHAGEQLCLLGANGSGKSTLLRLLSALAFAETGEVLFHGSVLTEQAFRKDEFSFSFRQRVGIVFQNPDVQLFNPTVFDELAFGPLQLRWPADRIRETAEAIMQEMDIAHLRNRPPHRLSGGEKKRVAIASVLILDPEVLLLDEPTAALDPKSEGTILDLLASWVGSGKTVITATHDLGNLERIATRCALFDNGAIAAEGEPLAVLHDVPLLERTRLIQVHRHTHAAEDTHAHGHVHRH